MAEDADSEIRSILADLTLDEEFVSMPGFTSDAGRLIMMCYNHIVKNFDELDIRDKAAVIKQYKTHTVFTEEYTEKFREAAACYEFGNETLAQDMHIPGATALGNFCEKVWGNAT